MLVVERGAVVDQVEPAVVDEQVGVARGAVDVRHQGIEPDDLGGEVGRGRIVLARRVGLRAAEEFDAEVQPDAGEQQLLDLGVGLAAADPGVELDRHQLRHRQAERPRQLARDHLRHEHQRPLPGAAELADVEAVVVGLEQSRQRAALAEGRHVTARGDGSESGGHRRSLSGSVDSRPRTRDRNPDSMVSFYLR